MNAYNAYSRVMFDPKALARVVAELARELPALQEKFDFDTIAVAGKSGCAVGFALSMVTGIHVVYVRKGESTHGDMIEGDGHHFTRYAFLDDFVSSGATKRRIHGELSNYAAVRKQSAPECVLTIEYQTSSRFSGFSKFREDATFEVAGDAHLPDHSFHLTTEEAA